MTFGAIYGKATNNYIGTVEMILATAWCGILYSLVGGQPMSKLLLLFLCSSTLLRVEYIFLHSLSSFLLVSVINGGTGPVLAFSEILYKVSKSMDVPFLTLNAWIGM